MFGFKRYWTNLPGAYEKDLAILAYPLPIPPGKRLC